MTHETHMRRCLALAEDALEHGEVPVGAVIADGGRIVAEAREQTRSRLDPLAHAEALAVQAACRTVGAGHLHGMTIYSTVEPCVLCGYVVRTVGLSRVVYGLPAGTLGACTSAYALLTDPAIPGWHAPPVVERDVLRDACASLMARYASTRPPVGHSRCQGSRSASRARRRRSAAA
jgi:tRNA(adenine34) deaminase